MSVQAGVHPHAPVDRIFDTLVENITFPQLRLQTVNITLPQASFASGNNFFHVKCSGLETLAFTDRPD